MTLPPVLTGLRFKSVAIDSRQAQPGDLFVALPGEHTDGHQYVEAALECGAVAALVRKDWAATQGSALGARQHVATRLIAVDDPLQTLQALSARHRAGFDLPVIGITGSVGKTSAKELVAAVLRQRLVTLANVKSFNNEIGVPLTLLRLEIEHQAAVLEMGTYGPGEITSLCALARPQYAIVTNVGPSHLERMKTLDTVALAKSELPAALPADGLAVLNGDDPRVRRMREVTPARVLLYGLDASNDIWADEIEVGGLAGLVFTAHLAGEQRRLQAPLLGRHNVYTALSAIAIARELGLDWEAIEAGLHDSSAQARLVARPGIQGAILLDDTYNASPVSCQAALDLLASLPGRRIAVFGDMAELGDEEEVGHRTVGHATAGMVDILVVVGAKARWIGEAAKEGAQAPEVLFAGSNAQAVELLRDLIGKGDYVLVKGARIAATEEIVVALSAVRVD